MTLHQQFSFSVKFFIFYFIYCLFPQECFLYGRKPVVFVISASGLNDGFKQHVENCHKDSCLEIFRISSDQSQWNIKKKEAYTRVTFFEQKV